MRFLQPCRSNNTYRQTLQHQISKKSKGQLAGEIFCRLGGSELMGRFPSSMVPSSMGRFPPLMGRFPECLNGPCFRNEKSAQRPKFSAGRPCGHPAKNFSQALQILEKQAFWHGHAARTSTKKLRSEKNFGLIFHSLVFPLKNHLQIGECQMPL